MNHHPASPNGTDEAAVDDVTGPSVDAEAGPADPGVLEVVEGLAAQMTGSLEHGERASGGMLDGLAAAVRAVGLRARREQPLLAGGTAELLVTDPGRPDQPDQPEEVDGPAVVSGVAVVVVDHGATDALRGRLRRLGAHREVAAVLVVSTRPRHYGLAGEVAGVPVRVVVVGGDLRWQSTRSVTARGPEWTEGPGESLGEGLVRTSRVPQRTG